MKDLTEKIQVSELFESDDEDWSKPFSDWITSHEPDQAIFQNDIITLSASMARNYPTRFVSRQPPVALGPMVDDGAPYSALGSTELRLLGMTDDSLDPIPESISSFKFWQFGSGAHSSPAKPILGSKNINFKSYSGQMITICHIVVSGSSPWLIGRNVTTNCDIIHLNGHFIRFPNTRGTMDKITLTNHDHHSYVLFSAVVTTARNGKSVNCLAGFGVTHPENQMHTWPYVK